MKIDVKILAYLSVVALFCALVGDRAQAQSGTSSGYGASAARGIRNQSSAQRFSVSNIQNRIRSQSVPSSGVAGVNFRSYGGANSSPRRSKPFSSLKRGPSVSPYLSLSGSFNGVSDYYNIVRPQNERARSNSRQQRQNQANQRRLNQIAARGPFSVQGSESLAPTGHFATQMSFENFQSLGNYFPPPQGLDKQR